jgi:gamma-glutamyl:cysteine ligase YbdK (ATP-grasp superfamily)
MTPLFSPHTFSTDWEIMVFDRLGRPVDQGQIRGFAGALTEELELPIHTDWGTLEMGLDVNSSFAQLQDRLHRLTRRATQMLAEHDMDLYPCGAHPTERFFNASHIHVGTLHDEQAAIRLETALFAFSPAFAALAANSPFHGTLRGKFKSYRIRNIAHGANRPGVPRDPDLSQPTWGHDASPKLYRLPTLEVRNIDGASSPAFLAELCVFVAAFVHQMSEQTDGQMIDGREYQDYLTNRWLAARDGLQATFGRQGKTIPVVDLLDEMLDRCAPSLARLGAKRGDLKLIGKMLQKRVGQADFAISVMNRYPDPYTLASAHGNLVRHWEAFDEYLATAPRQGVRPHPGREGVLQEHLNLVGQSTHYYRPRAAMHYPPGASEEIVEELVASGHVEREITATRGTLLHRRR